MDCSSKRGRGNNTSETTAAKTKKKAKGAVIKAEVVGEGEGGKGLMSAAEEEAAAGVEELRLSWRSGMDEEMPWATLWFPFWEMEKDAYDTLYGDVVWDFDIWGFKDGHNI